VAFDTETTGLSPVSDRIVEIAACAFGPDGVPSGTFERLVNPGSPIPVELTAIHGITDEMVRDAPGIESILPGFLDFIGDSVLIAHNAVYDVGMILVPLVRGLRLGTVPGAGGEPGNVVLDTCSLARAAFPGWGNYRLGGLAERLGIVHERAHRALSDVSVCRELFLRILETQPPAITLDGISRLDRLALRLETGAGRLREKDPPLAGALREGRTVWLEYHGGTKGRMPRPVTPITLIEWNGVRFLAGHCELDNRMKNFRLSRIRRVHETPAEAFTASPGPR